MQATLVIVEPKLEPGEYRVELPATIGRGRDAQVKFAHGLLSRQHCELVEDDGGIVVRDLGSRNGTFVSGRRIESAPLAPGELLTVGGITMRALYGNAEDVSLAPEDAESAKANALAETLPMEDTLAVSAKAADGKHAEESNVDEWPEEEIELEMEEMDSIELEGTAPSSLEPQSNAGVQENPLDADDMDWLNDTTPGSGNQPPSAKPPKGANDDDDFDRFLEGLR